MRLHIQQAPHSLEEGERRRITTVLIGALRNINVLLMGFKRGMKRCTFRCLLRVVGESCIDRINGEGRAGGVWGWRWTLKGEHRRWSVCMWLQGKANIHSKVTGQRYIHCWFLGGAAETSTDQEERGRTNSCPLIGQD